MKDGHTQTKWVINWGDGFTNTYTNLTGGFAAGYQPPAHTYTTSAGYTVSATAYTSANVSSVAAMTLSNSFGKGGGLNAPGSGKATAVPTNSTGDARGQAMAVDHSGTSLDGYTYVASNYTLFGGTTGQQFAITRFTPQGAVDQTWANVGTFVISKFASGTSTDTPSAMDITPDGSQIAVVGKSSTAGWAVALISVGDGTLNNPPTVLWKNTAVAGSSIGGQANAVTFGDYDTGSPGREHVVTVVGTDASQTHMVAAQFGTPDGMLNPSFGDFNAQGVQTGKVVVPNAIPGFPNLIPLTAVANAIIEPDGTLDEGFMIGGTVSFCGGSIASTGSDMVLVALLPNGTYYTAFGNNGIAATNVGYNGAAGQCGGAMLASYDSDYSLVASLDSITSKEYITAVGSSSYQSSTGQIYSTTFAVERFNLTDGTLDKSGFGPGSGTSHTGYVLGPNGTAYAAALDNTTDHPNAIVAVGTGANNFLAARFNFDGTLDENFGTHGVVGNTDFGDDNGTANTIDYARSVFIRPDGSILVGGYEYTTGTNGKIALAELLDKNKVSVL